MAYKLAEQLGDTLPVPQIVLTHLPQAEGDAVRVALYLLQTGQTDPKALARALALPSVETARRALQYWAGAGLLVQERAKAAPDMAKQPTETEQAAQIDLATLNDPNIAALCTEAQTALGKALGRSELQKLVALYLNDGWPVDVILLSCAETARQGRRTVAAAARELARWREQGVETGEDAERWLQRAQQREGWYAETAAQFGMEPTALTRWEKSAINRWREDWNAPAALVDEALLRAGAHNTIRYVDGILRAWRAQGITTVEAARGQGQLAGNNILTTERPAAAQPAASAQKDLFNRDWNAVFDEEV